MGIVRNFIDIEGITSSEELPKEIKGQLIQTSEIENIYIGNKVSNIKNIYQIIINMYLKSQRIIDTKIGKVIVADFIRNYKIIYYDNNNVVNILELKLPYNTFIELDKNKEIYDVKAYIVDSYFELIDNDTLYNYSLYFINVIYSKECSKKSYNEFENCRDIKNKQPEDNSSEDKNHNFYIDEVGVSEEAFYSIDEKILCKKEFDELESEYL